LGFRYRRPGNTFALDPAVAVSHWFLVPARRVSHRTVQFWGGDFAPWGLSITLPPHGHIARFISELFPNITPPFTGALHVVANVASTGTPANFSVTGLRGRYNSRKEFLVATVTPVVDAASGTTQFYLPHLVSGGGYSTRVFFVNTANGWSAGDIRFRTPDGNLVPLQK